MTHRVSTFAVLIIIGSFLCTIAHGAFDPGALGKSTVRITIKQGDQVRSAATGFVWQDPRHIVTSLHVMHHGADAEAIVEFDGRKRRANVVKVLPKADLMLLEVDDPIDGWIPLTHYQGSKPPYKAPISALGYNSGASGSTTREFRKGHADPEVLKGLLPPKDRKELAAVKIPDIELEIYYLDGSLLPGFSGSPVVDADGELIGIGNGGLENGASNVSWVIPARFLDELTASTMTSLPDQLGKAQQSFSADLDLGQEDYREIAYEGFVFVKTKTRTLAEILESSDDPEGLLDVFSMFEDYRVAYETLQFDIYEDLENGLIIAMPNDMNLSVDEFGVLGAEARDDEVTNDLLFDAFARSDVGSVEDYLNEMADEHLTDLNEYPLGFVRNADMSWLQSFGEDKHVLHVTFDTFGNDELQYHEIDYVTFAVSRETVFQAEGALYGFDTEFMEAYERNAGTDCTQPELSSEQEYICNEIRKMMRILSSVHLIRFANAASVKAPKRARESGR